jgi:hypothetical protein
MMTISGFQRPWVHSHSTHNIDMAVGPEEGGKLAHGRIQSASQSAPRRAGKRSCLMGPKDCSARAALAGAKRPFFFTGFFEAAALDSDLSSFNFD